MLHDAKRARVASVKEAWPWIARTRGHSARQKAFSSQALLLTSTKIQSRTVNRPPVALWQVADDYLTYTKWSHRVLPR